MGFLLHTWVENTVHGVETLRLSGKENIPVVMVSKEGHADVIYSHNKYAYIHMYMFMQHHNDTINNQTDAQW